MSFKVAKKTIKCDVEFDMEGDNGEEINAAIVITFVRPTTTSNEEFSTLATNHIVALQKIQGAIEAVKDTSEDARDDSAKIVVDLKTKGNKEYQKLVSFVSERIKGWDGVYLSDDSEPDPFTPERLQELFETPEAKDAVIARYRKLTAGRKEQAAKNSGKQDEAG